MITTNASNNKSSKKIKAVLFDLDGTLVDTAKDFVRILHELAVENNFQTPSNQKIREQVSAGSKAMVSLFVDATKDNSNNIDDAEINQLRQQFLDSYEANICVDSDIFIGLESLLNELEKQNIQWGVVTNKPRYLSEKLLSELRLANKCAVLVCPEDVTQSKPDPEPMYLAMETIGIAKKDADTVIYIGDHIRDIQAGNLAGNITITAGYGYIAQDEDSTAWGADYRVDTSAELVSLITTLL